MEVRECLYTYAGKLSVPEVDRREQVLVSAAVRLLCAVAPRYGCHVVCIDRFLSGVRCAGCLMENVV